MGRYNDMLALALLSAAVGLTIGAMLAIVIMAIMLTVGY